MLFFFCVCCFLLCSELFCLAVGRLYLYLFCAVLSLEVSCDKQNLTFLVIYYVIYETGWVISIFCLPGGLQSTKITQHVS